MIALLHRAYHRRKLARIVETERNSFRCQDFRKRRSAALKARRV